jgi:asparagine synthase (glutamine-hydrolysing)
MPGIFGVVEAVGRSAAYRDRALVEIVEQMAAAMKYDALYSCEIFSRPELGACVGRVGWPGDIDSGGVKKKDASLVLVTAGEPICDSSPDRGWSEDGGVEQSGVGALDTARAYSRFGEDAFGELNGVFAGFLMDRRREKCLLFNDRYGMERLFLYQEGTRTFFSSEAKAILAVAPRTRTFDPEGLAQFLGCGCTLGTRSLFRGIEVLDGGTLVSFSVGDDVRRRAYFDRAALEETEVVPERSFLPGFYGSLKSAVNDAVKRPPRVAISLTGGLDSRMIMACLEAAPGSVPCYTFGSMYRDTFDVSVGRQVAAQCGQPHQVLELGTQFLRSARGNLEDAVFISDGYLGISGAAELYLNHMARSIAPVRMTGNWGGELLRGVRAFKYLEPKGRFLSPALMRQFRESSDGFSSMSTLNPLSFTLFHQVPHQGYGRYAIERSQVVMRSPFLDKEVVRWLYQAPASSRRASECSSAVVERGRSELLAIPTDQGLLGVDSWLARSARRFYRQALFKAEYWTSYGASPWSLIERMFRGRHKFQHFRPWLRSELAELIRETLLQGNRADLQAWFDMDKVERIVKGHLEGRGNYTDEIDKLMTIALASRRLLKASPRRDG